MASPPAPARLPVPPPVTGTTFALLNDEPVPDEEQDLLGARRAADQLSGLLVASRNATPLTLAVDAGWGMGKSTLMRLVDRRLVWHPEVHTVWYNAWTSTGGDALEGLIKSVLMRVDPSILRATLRRIRGRGTWLRLARAATVLAAAPLGVAAMVDELWTSLSVDAAARNGMRDALRVVVRKWQDAVPAGAPGRLLVVFIDDLDRCSEETVLAVCEAVKVYLDVPGLAFVVGCDRTAIGPGGLLRDLSPAGAAFMEKIFQTSYRIPAASGRDIQNYVRWCAQQAGIGHMLDQHLVELLAYRAARNPRRIKRLVNGLLLEARLNPIWDGVNPEGVIRTLLLQYLYPDFYRMMTVPAGPGDVDVVWEFLTYRGVRAALLSDVSWTSALTATVDGFLQTYAVRPLLLDTPSDRPRALAEAERQLPTGFPQLVNDPAFTSLVDELVALPESALVLRRLREGLDETGPTQTPLPVPAPEAARAEADYWYAPLHTSPDPAVEQDATGSWTRPDPLPAADPRTPGRQQPQPQPRVPSERSEGYGDPQQPGRRRAPASPDQDASPRERGRRRDAAPVPAAPPESQPRSAAPAGASRLPGDTDFDAAVENGTPPDWYAQQPPSPQGAVFATPQNAPPQLRQADVLLFGFDMSTVRSLERLFQGSDLIAREVPTDTSLTDALHWYRPRALICGFDHGDLPVDALARMRESGDYTGLTVLCTSRHTPAREEAVQRLGGVFADSAAWAADVVIPLLTDPRLPPDDPSAAPTSPPPPASDGRPR